MQLDSEIVRSGLAHDDPIVRQACLCWINDKGPRLAPRTADIVGAYSRFGLPAVSHIQVRECDNRLFDWILEQAAQDFGESRFDDLQFRLVWNWMRRANIDLLRSRLSDVRSGVAAWHARHTAAHTQLSVVSEIEARLTTFDLGPDECWRQLIQKCRLIDSGEGEKYSHDQYWVAVKETEKYLECAAQGNIAPLVMGALEEHDRSTATIEIAAMIQLAERMHLEEAAPFVLGLMDPDWDHLNEVITSYFQENCGESLQHLVSQGFEDRKWHEQLYLRAIFSANHSAVSAGHLRKFLAHELSVNGDEDAVELAQALASQFCTEDTDTLDTLYQTNQHDPEHVQVAEFLHALTVLGAMDDPRDRSWSKARKTAKKLHAREAQSMRMQQPSPFDDEAAEFDGPVPHESSNDTTIRKETAYHVGRNDPCPCGSGKKYKKCCL